MNLRLDGKVAALSIKENLKIEFASLARKACLAIVHFNDPASASYLKGRLKIADELGVDVKVIGIEENQTQEELINIIESLNNDSNIDGIMVDRPLPKRFNEFEILSLLNPNKDVDGYTPMNLGKLVSNQDCYISCTPGAAIRLVDFYNIDGEIIFGELTFQNGSGYINFEPDEFDFIMGDKFILPERTVIKNNRKTR